MTARSPRARTTPMLHVRALPVTNLGDEALAALPGEGRRSIQLKHQPHRLRHVTEAVALLGEMPYARPRQMVDQRRHALGC
jgi:hypothetical protein